MHVWSTWGSSLVPQPGEETMWRSRFGEHLLSATFFKVGLIRLKLFAPKHCGIEGQNFIPLAPPVNLTILNLIYVRSLEVMIVT